MAGGNFIQADFIGTVMTATNLIVGLGILTIPSTVKAAGWASMAMLAICAAVFCYTACLMGQIFRAVPTIQSYGDMGGAAFGGHPGRLFISAVLILQIYAVCVEAIILEAANLAALFPHAALHGLQLNPKQIFGILTAIIILILMWLRKFRIMYWIAAVVGVIGRLAIVLCVIFLGFDDAIGFRESGVPIRWGGIPYSVAIFGLWYTQHSVFPILYQQMGNKEHFSRAMVVSFSVSTVIYGVIAIAGYCMFGDYTLGQITLNLPPHAVAAQAAIWITVVIPFTKCAILMDIMAISIEALLPARIRDSWSCFIVLRITLLLTVTVVALVVPYFSPVISLVGSLLGFFLALIVPAVCFLRSVGNATRFQIIMASAMIALATTGAALGTYSFVAKLHQ